ncbi:Coiled-coil domain-containing protein 137 [Cricetulus griseus]|uniref:Coiled-coil domain-containing protein 137 n=1 Tax=Cricetulus griseus TaxID=10029 RepID=G3IPN0_CRIGR|nr:Coiled-coil domain-containing protein 137 [Cricetulus griseus]
MLTERCSVSHIRCFASPFDAISQLPFVMECIVLGPSRMAMFTASFQKRRLEKAQKKKEARAVDRLEQELLKDTVEFGEVVLQPPDLTVQPRRGTGRDAPGKKSLMLKMLLGAGGVSLTPSTSLARQRILGEERERAVQAYRALKKQQRQEVTLTQPPGSSSQRKPQTCL